MTMRQARLTKIRQWIADTTEIPPTRVDVETQSLMRLSDQCLHLLAAAIDNVRMTTYK
jgi:hypothetical protein